VQHLLGKLGTTAACTSATSASLQLGQTANTVCRSLADGAIGDAIANADVHARLKLEYASAYWNANANDCQLQNALARLVIG
jgi:hypothetical protein